MVHSRTPNPAAVVQQADIIIAAVGVPEMVTRSWVKRGAAVIDVGTNAVDVRPRPVSVCDVAARWLFRRA